MEYKVFTYEEIERAKTDKDLRNEIVLNYYALAVKLTSSFYARIPRPVEQFDDYLNEALMGINDAITKFDKDKNVEFGSFAFAYARWYIKNLSRRRVYGDKEQHDLENNKAFAFDRMQLMSTILDAPTESCDNKTLKETIEDPNIQSMTLNIENEEFWKIIKKHVKPRAFKCLYLRFVYEYSYTEIGEILGCTKQNVNHSIRSSLETLRNIHELKKYVELF